METHSNTPTASEARELLARAEGMGTSATQAAGWPTAMVFNSLAILGSMLMVGLQIVAHTGYGAQLVVISVTVLVAVNATIWPFMQRTTKSGFTKRFHTSLAAYMGLYVAAIIVAVTAFPNGNLAYYLGAAIVLAAVGLAAAIRELRA